jgi:hypothetical protein
MFGKKRAQISLFVIVGLVVLIVVALMLFLRKKADSPADDSAAERITYELQAGALKDHVLSCINRAGSDALEKLGENGGVIYDFDGGKIPFKASVLGANYLDYSFQDKNYHVAYGLRANSYCQKMSYFTPDYPLSDVPFSRFNSEYNHETDCVRHHPSSDYDGFFGAVNLSKLCYSARSSGCEGFASGNILGFTMQKQLEDYVTTHLPLCVNFSAFSDKMKADILQESAPSVEVEVHDSETLFFVHYPIRIVFENQEPVSLVVDYQSRLDVRLGALYNFIYNSLSMDSKNIRFNPATQYATLAYWKQGLSMARIKDACKACTLPYSEDDILEFSDAKSLVNGHPFVFRTAVQNRRPAVDFIPDQSLDWNARLNLNIDAFDPDDSNVFYYFMSEGLEGWREDSNSIASISRDLNDDPSILIFDFRKKDIGNHTVRVLVADDSGLFDYEEFNIEVTGQLDYRENLCFALCTATEPLDYCESWCTIAKNQCNADDDNCPGCYGGWWNEFPSIPKTCCKECVERVTGYGELEPHINCNTLSSYASCISELPDCFWVNESISVEPPRFEERCANDHELSQLGVSGFPEFPNYIIK